MALLSGRFLIATHFYPDNCWWCHFSLLLLDGWGGAGWPVGDAAFLALLWLCGSGWCCCYILGGAALSSLLLLGAGAFSLSSCGSLVSGFSFIFVNENEFQWSEKPPPNRRMEVRKQQHHTKEGWDSSTAQKERGRKQRHPDGGRESTTLHHLPFLLWKT